MAQGAGDQVERDEVIAAISTDKIDTDVEAPAAGRVEEILVEVGETVEVGTVLRARSRRDAKPGEAHARGLRRRGTSEADAALQRPAPPASCRATRAERHAEPASAARPTAGRRAATRPSCMRIAAEHGIDLEAVEGTGRGGRVRKQDVLAPSRTAPRAPPSRRCTSSRPYRPDAPAAPRRAPRSRPPRRPPPTPAGARRRCRACAARSAAHMVESLQHGGDVHDGRSRST